MENRFKELTPKVRVKIDQLINSIASHPHLGEHNFLNVISDMDKTIRVLHQQHEFKEASKDLDRLETAKHHITSVCGDMDDVDHLVTGINRLIYKRSDIIRSKWQREIKEGSL